MFDFMGACDLMLLHAPNFHENAALDIHIRTSTRYDYSYIESAAVQIGSDILEVDSFASHVLNGVTEAKLPATIGDVFAITRTVKDSKSTVYEIAVAGDEAIELRVFKDWVSVSIKTVGRSRARYMGSVGMMGDAETGSMLSRDGKTVLDDVNAFAREWQVRADEPLLFQTVRAPQYPAACELPSVDSTNSRRLGGLEVSREDAMHACARFASAPSKEACIQDVMAMGDLDLAQSGVY